jgi:thiosulfate dehydrogenase [quinone] large subunit
MNRNLVKLSIRMALALGFLSAVADRLGVYPEEISVWGNWQSFVDYTGLINPWLPPSLVGTMNNKYLEVDSLLGKSNLR